MKSFIYTFLFKNEDDFIKNIGAKHEKFYKEINFLEAVNDCYPHESTKEEVDRFKKYIKKLVVKQIKKHIKSVAMIENYTEGAIKIFDGFQKKDINDMAEKIYDFQIEKVINDEQKTYSQHS